LIKSRFCILATDRQTD